MLDNVDNQLPIHDANKDGMVTLEEYFENSFGEVEGKPLAIKVACEMVARSAEAFVESDIVKPVTAKNGAMFI